MSPLHAPTHVRVAATVGPIVAVGAAAALTAVREPLHEANLALVLVLVVVGAAAAGGRRAGTTTAIAAALGFNFFLTEPYLSLRIADAQDLLSFVLLLVAGLAVGQLAHVARLEGRRADRFAGDLTRLHELAELAAHGASAEILLDRSTAYLVAELGLTGCRFVWGADPEGLPPALDHRGALPPGELRHVPGGFELPAGGLALPVADELGAVVGHFVLEPSPRRPVSLIDRKAAVLVADVVGPPLARRPR